LFDYDYGDSYYQWRLRHSGSSSLARVFDYDLYCRTGGEATVRGPAGQPHVHR